MNKPGCSLKHLLPHLLHLTQTSVLWCRASYSYLECLTTKQLLILRSSRSHPFYLLSFNTAFRLSSQAAYLWVVSCSLCVPSQVVEEKWLKEIWNTANFCTAGLWQSYFLFSNQLQKAFLTSSTVPSAQICPPNKIQSRHLIRKPNKVFSEAGD